MPGGELVHRKVVPGFLLGITTMKHGASERRTLTIRHRKVEIEIGLILLRIFPKNAMPTGRQVHG